MGEYAFMVLREYLIIFHTYTIEKLSNNWQGINGYVYIYNTIFVLIATFIGINTYTYTIQKIIEYFKSTINAYSPISHKLWIPL